MWVAALWHRSKAFSDVVLEPEGGFCSIDSELKELVYTYRTQ